MTLDGAIKHYKEEAEKYMEYGIETECYQCGKENEQLAEWLTELADIKDEIEYCSGDINERIAKAEEERKCFNDVDISYNQGYIEGLREGEKYINRIKFKKEIQAEIDKILNGNIVGIEIIDGLPE